MKVPKDPPEWESNDGKECTMCKAKFTLTNRKHHCRGCGKLVCNACSQKRVRYPPEWLMDDKQRACDACYRRYDNWNRNGKVKQIQKISEKNAGFVHILVLSGNCLNAADLSGYSDPFCTLRINDLVQYKTKVVHRSLHPAWQEEIVLFAGNLRKDILECTVFDKDLVGKDDSLGTSYLPLSRLTVGRPEVFVLRLQGGDTGEDLRALLRRKADVVGNKAVDKVVEKSANKAMGKVGSTIAKTANEAKNKGMEKRRAIRKNYGIVVVRVVAERERKALKCSLRKDHVFQRYKPVSAREHKWNKSMAGLQLVVVVRAAANLTSTDLGPSSKNDPYVVLEYGGEKRQTAVKFKDSFPNWNETFRFPIRKQDEVLVLSVYDRDLLDSDDPLGSTATNIHLDKTIMLDYEDIRVARLKGGPAGNVKTQLVEKMAKKAAKKKGKLASAGVDTSIALWKVLGGIKNRGTLIYGTSIHLDNAHEH